MRTSPTFALVAGCLALAVTIACTQGPSPTSPSPAAAASSELGPGGSTLKVPAPTPLSPANGVQLTQSSNVPLVVSNVAGSHSNFPITIEFEVRTAAGTVIVNPKVAQGSGSTSYTIPATLVTSATYTWRARATYSGAFGPWSSAFTFRAPDIPPPFIRGNEVFDPLTDGRSAGTVNGPVQWLPGVGVKLLHNTSHITYVLPTNLQAGSYSMMVKGVDESNPGDKSKIMSMQEGLGDVTTNDYRMTAELRGRFYVTPGAVQGRLITGDAGNHGRIHDTPRIVLDFNDESWYFWRVIWGGGRFTVEVRLGGESGSTVYLQTIGTGANPYRPVPHVVHVGQPVGRAGEIDATAAGMIVKNVWISNNSRPTFPFPSTLFALPGEGNR